MGMPAYLWSYSLEGDGNVLASYRNTKDAELDADALRTVDPDGQYEVERFELEDGPIGVRAQYSISIIHRGREKPYLSPEEVARIKPLARVGLKHQTAWIETTKPAEVVNHNPDYLYVVGTDREAVIKLFAAEVA